MTPAARKSADKTLKEVARFLDALTGMDDHDDPELAALIDEARFRRDDCLRAASRLYE